MRMPSRLRVGPRGLRVIPSLFTLGNAVCGFAAIVQVATLRFDPVSRAIENPENLAHAAWLILLAMVFDALDGRIARLTKTTGDFGGELDSLCDAISFGVAPGVMVAMANAMAITNPLFARFAWVCGAAHACGAILRLARFNVENSHDEDAHLYFKGLPSPAAAGAIVSAVLLQSFALENGWAGAAAAIAWSLPFVALASGYLMVSAIRYPHVPNKYLRGRRSPRRIALIFFPGAMLFATAPEVAVAVTFLGIAAWGPIERLIEVLRGAAPAPLGAAAAARAEAVSAAASAGAPAASPRAPGFELKPATAAPAGDIRLPSA